MDTFTDRDWRYFFYIHELLDPKSHRSGEKERSYMYKIQIRIPPQT